VSGTTAPSQKKLMLFSGRAYPELADEVADCLDIERAPARLYDFANGEIMVRFLESVRGCDAFVLQSHTAPINEWIMEHLIMVDALKRASAKRITVVAPFFGYARQDKKSRGREPISARLMADLFETAGADRLMAVDLHTAQIQGFFDGPVDHLFALPILAGYLENKLNVRNVTVVAPDAGRVRVCERWTDRLGCPLAIIHKRRDPDVANQVKVFEVVGQVSGRTCILVDDMIDTGATIAKAAEALFDQGADRVIVAATHGVLSGPAIDILKNSRISEVVITNTLPVPQEKRFDKLTVLSIAPLLARAINEVFSDGSVTSLFDGQSLDGHGHGLGDRRPRPRQRHGDDGHDPRPGRPWTQGRSLPWTRTATRHAISPVRRAGVSDAGRFSARVVALSLFLPGPPGWGLTPHGTRVSRGAVRHDTGPMPAPPGSRVLPDWSELSRP
jgi:ribose-phosphate pyrophosphokinase